MWPWIFTENMIHPLVKKKKHMACHGVLENPPGWVTEWSHDGSVCMVDIYIYICVNITGVYWWQMWHHSYGIHTDPTYWSFSLAMFDYRRVSSCEGRRVSSKRNLMNHGSIKQKDARWWTSRGKFAQSREKHLFPPASLNPLLLFTSYLIPVL